MDVINYPKETNIIESSILNHNDSWSAMNSCDDHDLINETFSGLLFDLKTYYFRIAMDAICTTSAVSGRPVAIFSDVAFGPMASEDTSSVLLPNLTSSSTSRVMNRRGLSLADFLRTV